MKIATFISDLKYQSMKSLDLNYFYGYQLFLGSDNTSENIVELDTLFRICSQACDFIIHFWARSRLDTIFQYFYDVKYFHDLKWPLDQTRFENLLKLIEKGIYFYSQITLSLWVNKMFVKISVEPLFPICSILPGLGSYFLIFTQKQTRCLQK